MKKRNLISLLLLLFPILLPPAPGQLSQEDAGIICNQYAGEGESVQVMGPVSCEGSYWLCGFTYFGNKQNILLAVSRSTGAVLPETSDIFHDLISTRYAEEYGATRIFSQFITDPTLAIELRGMNATMFNYENMLRSAMEEGTITRAEFAEISNEISSVVELGLELADMVDGLYNASMEFLASPDCVELLDYMDHLNTTLGLARNFSMSWNEFIDDYNSIVTRPENIQMVAINPSDAQIFAQRLASVLDDLEQYRGNVEEFRETVIGNVITRLERKETKDKLDEAYDIVSTSRNPDAKEKYNQASRAFSSGEYQKARSLINEAIALARIELPEDDHGPVVVVERASDYTPYFIAIGVLLLAILVIMLARRRGEEKDENEEGEDEENRKESAGTGTWSWTREGHSALERV